MDFIKRIFFAIQGNLNLSCKKNNVVIVFGKFGGGGGVGKTYLMTATGTNVIEFFKVSVF